MHRTYIEHWATRAQFDCSSTVAYCLDYRCADSQDFRIFGKHFWWFRGLKSKFENVLWIFGTVFANLSRTLCVYLYYNYWQLFVVAPFCIRFRAPSNHPILKSITRCSRCNFTKSNHKRTSHQKEIFAAFARTILIVLFTQSLLWKLLVNFFILFFFE